MFACVAVVGPEVSLLDRSLDRSIAIPDLVLSTKQCSGFPVTRILTPNSLYNTEQPALRADLPERQRGDRDAGGPHQVPLHTSLLARRL